MKFSRRLQSINKRNLAVLGISAALAFFSFTALNNVLPELNVASNDPAVQTQETLAAVGALMILPQNETPTIFNVDDSEVLKAQQTFFADAQNGDVLLVYPQSAKAIIYSPERDMIINAGPITFDQQ